MSSFFSRFNDKKVALVGTSPQLKGQALGKLIDEHDEIIRINCSTAESQDTGFKTTIRFVGATFRLSQWDQLDTSWFPCQHWIKNEIITTTKNATVFKLMNKGCHFYDASLPMQCLEVLPRITNIRKNELAKIGRPPTSGTVALILLLCESKPAQINLFGISTRMSPDLYKKYDDNKIHAYDKIHTDTNHMDRETECWIRQELIASHRNVLTAY